jgi:segregation and condensation protein A
MSPSESHPAGEPDEPRATLGDGTSGVNVGGSYGVKLQVFEGPLDLLLHLIRQNEVDIIDIPVAKIAEQYVEYLDVMQSLDLDVAAEYLVMAATLAYIKSRMLLPPTDEELDDDEIDPRAELVARLLEFQRYKEVASALSKRRWLGRDVYDAKGIGPNKVPDDEREIEVGLFELIEAFRLVLKTVPDEPQASVHILQREEVTVRDQMMFVMKTIEGSGSSDFLQLFALGGPSRTVLIATFLAILELARLGAVAIYQGQNEVGAPDGAIRLRVTRNTNELSWDERISEFM